MMTMMRIVLIYVDQRLKWISMVSVGQRPGTGTKKRWRRKVLIQVWTGYLDHAFWSHCRSFGPGAEVLYQLKKRIACFAIYRCKMDRNSGNGVDN